MAEEAKTYALTNVKTESGVNEKGEPFTSIRCIANEAHLFGQLSPDEMRGIAAQFYEVAFAADRDAAVWHVIKELGLPPQAAALIISKLRDMRA